MNWKEEVADKLRKYPIMTNAAESIPMELKNLEQEACSLQSARAGRTGGRNLRGNEDRLMGIMVKQLELENRLDAVENWLKFMDNALQKLPEWDMKVLELIYIQRQSTAQICADLGMERSSLYRYRDAALKNLTLSMYGALES